jgi:lipopolysaccharide core heptose(I) kinase
MKCQQKTVFNMPAALRKALGDGDKCDTFERAMALQGKAFRDVPGRKTSQVELLGKHYFIKQHFGVGWGEIFKNIISLKKPILGAMTEVQAIQKVTSLGVATTPLVAYGQRGCNPANLQSFVMTEDLGDITSLEELCAEWKENPPSANFKRHLIVETARIAKKIHENGVNHRDFYLCHLCLDNKKLPAINLLLIDLHRVLIHKTPSEKANMKDVAALYFSCMDVGLTVRDYLRFKKHYQNQSNDFWQQVEARANALYIKFNSDKFQKKLADERTKLD